MRWLRLDVSWDDSPWLFVLSEGSQLAWIKLLCHVKVWGVGGKCKSLSPIVAAKKWGVGEESVTKMLQAAITDGALLVDGSAWLLVNWDKYQELDPTAAERKRRERARKSVTLVTPVTVCHGVTPVTQGVTRHATETETETERELVVSDSKGGAGGSKSGSVAVVRASRFTKPTPAELEGYFLEVGMPVSEAGRFWDHFESNGWRVGGKTPMKDWKASARNWQRNFNEKPNRNGKPVMAPIEERYATMLKQAGVSEDSE